MTVRLGTKLDSKPLQWRRLKAFPVYLNFTALASDTLNTLVRVFAPFKAFWTVLRPPWRRRSPEKS